VLKAAAAIANERGGRRGAPPIENILEILPAHLKDEVLQDARAALEAADQLALLEENPRDRSLIPPDLIDSLHRYAGEDRVETGGFLRACLENDFAGACARAKGPAVAALPAIASFIFNELPDRCWGSRNKVNRWLKRQEIESEPEPESTQKGEA
jgi:hypothetical protein